MPRKYHKIARSVQQEEESKYVLLENGGPCRGRTSGPLTKSPAEVLSRTTSKRNYQRRVKICDGIGHPRSWCVKMFWHQVGSERFIIVIFPMFGIGHNNLLS
jgi:hypothetical protein